MEPLTWSAVADAGEIVRRWAELGNDDGDERGLAQGRALTLNLICRARDAADAERAAGWLWKLGLRHPARVLIVAPVAGAAPRARVAAHPRGSEMVEVRLAPERAASWVAPLLASDLPVVLYWRGGGPGDGSDFGPLAAMANRVLVDAHSMHLSAQRLADLIAGLRPTSHLTDLTWTRLTPWRQLLCQGLEAERDGFRRISRVSITAGHGQCATDSLAAILLAGWMAQQLQWGSETALGSQALRLQGAAGTAVTVRFQPCPSEERHGLLRRLVVEGEENGMSVVIQHRGQHLSMNVRGGGRLLGEWAAPASGATRSEATMLSEEFGIHAADALFLNSLRRGLELIAPLEAVPA